MLVDTEARGTTGGVSVTLIDIGLSRVSKGIKGAKGARGGPCLLRGLGDMKY